MTIVDKAKEVQEKIIAACKRSGRDPQDVQLLPVSKNLNVEGVLILVCVEVSM